MSIFIFRRDFRIKDNTAWNKMVKENVSIYPIFIFTPEQIDNNSYKSNNAVQFMIESLLELKKTINLTLCYGDIEDVLKDIINKNTITSIYTNTDYTPYSIKREKLLTKICKLYNIKFNYYHDITLFEPKTILNKTGSVYQKFTPFYIECMKQKNNIRSIYSVNIITTKHVSISTKYKADKKLDTFYTYNDKINIHGGRINALKTLSSVPNHYEKTRNFLHINTTNLSAYLKFGCISIREAYHKLNKYGMLIRQLIWREFYYHIGHGYIERFGKSLKGGKYDMIKWENNMTLFKKWKKGLTGFPIVDACMTQLNTTGYMHNRGRLIVASFLVKNLRIDWKYGEKYFATKLIDYDVYVNQGNWQWVAGTGADSMPYFRIFNPSLQSAKYDKEAIYIKKWLPQLKDIIPKHLHDWEKYHTNIYIKPIINYNDSKKKTLAMYR